MTATAGYVQVATTHDDRQEADRLAALLVGARLAACSQVDGPITSTYWWQGQLETAAEWRITFKTRAALTDALVKALGTAHSYDVPEIVVTPLVAGLPAYLEWIDAETTDGPVEA
ncbi:divalent-cation tolerance protein CutA [Promicromonospora sukumoe]|uniref:divalent-cation tolerance protein CutA n=1 Tax=Promicromonospora sukumoe TaxID=88382 RepID=UPI0037C726A9